MQQGKNNFSKNSNFAQWKEWKISQWWLKQYNALMKHTEDLREWYRIHSRRLHHNFHNMVAGHRMAGPISYLVASSALAIILTLTTLYAPSYMVTINGEAVGIVTDDEMVEEAIAAVEQQGTDILGYEYQVEDQIDYQFVISLRTDLSTEKTLENYFYGQLEKLTGEMRKYQVLVDGTVVGVAKDEAAMEELLENLKVRYVSEDTVSSHFLNTVELKPVYQVENIMTMSEMEDALLANKDGSTTYTVVAGDTFNAIAYANDMSVSDLKALNPDVDINRLMVGDILNVKELTPILSIQTTDEVTYTQSIACPVETREDSSMYVGSSKIITQGVEGEEQVEATVTYINGQETAREITSTTVLREPTTTIKAVGTKEKPKTASTGTYRWPVSGRITSYFGSRYIFGSYSYHSGIDISTSYGAAICAADGGTVTYAGYKGSYGNLVIITHDNGTQTYYAHNSSLLVSTGQKVYKGQQIAKAGSTGRSTGTHCHFEVRVNGRSVNPLSYLS